MWAAGQFCGSGAFVDEIVAVRTTHEAFHIGERISVGPVFDAWAGRARDALPQSRRVGSAATKRTTTASPQIRLAVEHRQLA
jgi:hypothetical protein